MALKYKVLEKFSQEAREYAASRVYDRCQPKGYVCADGRCVLANLVLFDKGVALDMPNSAVVTACLGYSANGMYANQLDRIIEANDSGDLATPEAVRALLLGDTTPTGAAAAGVGA